MTRKNDNIYFWIVEQYYHSMNSQDSWGKPIKVCETEEDAINTWKLEAELYSSDFENAKIDTSIDKMITVRESDSFYPNMDFWYYKVQLIEEE